MAGKIAICRYEDGLSITAIQTVSSQGHATAAPPGAAPHRGGLWLRSILSAAVIAAVFALHYRYVLVHFSIGGTPLDSGWFA